MYMRYGHNQPEKMGESNPGQLWGNQVHLLAIFCNLPTMWTTGFQTLYIYLMFTVHVERFLTESLHDVVIYRKSPNECSDNTYRTTWACFLSVIIGQILPGACLSIKLRHSTKTTFRPFFWDL
jgi:hypothetical protein